MTRVITLTQLVFIALGTMALTILIKTQGAEPDLTGQWRVYFSQNGLWFLLIPFVWYGCTVFALRTKAPGSVQAALRMCGIALTILIAAAYGWLILSA